MNQPCLQAPQGPLLAGPHLGAVVDDWRSGEHELHHGRQSQAPDVSARRNQEAVHVVVVEEAGPTGVPGHSGGGPGAVG
ncbi:MAG: hypothetical protein NTZ40_14305 [Cyanobacteria bacterium]|nr:hypothetical protein [Cyanobacteriota bacterium]